jgi:putative ABC transport system permease protein
VGGFAAALAVAAIAGYALIRLVARLRGAASGPWRYGLANLRRRTGASLVQIMALGLGIMAMLMLTLVAPSSSRAGSSRCPRTCPTASPSTSRATSCRT